MSTISVIGAGYVGLTTSACLAHLGHEVICVDIDQEKIRQLKQGKIPIHETGLPELVQTGISNRCLQFVVGAKDAVASSEFVFLCLPTPQEEDGRADVDALLSVVNQIREVVSPGTIIVNKSTVPVGTNTTLATAIRRDDVSVVSNPEFLREGAAVTDFLQPDRIVIGANDSKAGDRVAQIYESIDAPIVHVDLSLR